MAALLMCDADADALIRHVDTVGDDQGGDVMRGQRPGPDIVALVANDLEFHQMIAVGSANPVLCFLIDGLSG